jgi:ABC-2 type transport system ATP-binding protein
MSWPDSRAEAERSGYVLKSEKVTRRFGFKVAVDAMDLEIQAGHVYAMLGPNGSGKTTWMKMAAGLVKPSSGKVLFEGRPVGTESRKKVAYMPTEPYFYLWMSVRDLGRYYRDFFADFSMDRYRELLGQMELEEGLKAKTLSSGMAAKLKIALTMARDAKVYLLDEPFNGIDLLARDEIRACILREARPEKALVLSSHLVEEMEAIADRAVFIKQGKLVEERDLEEMRTAEGVSMADRYRAIFGHAKEDRA